MIRVFVAILVIAFLAFIMPSPKDHPVGYAFGVMGFFWVCYFTLLGLAVYVAVHFIRKYW